MGKKENELLPGTLDMLILKTLKTLGPMHGYGISQYIQQVSDDVLQVDEGSLDPALQRLLLNGWVEAEGGQSANNRRARFYRLTASGRKQLVREESSFDRIMQAISRVMRPEEG